MEKGQFISSEQTSGGSFNSSSPITSLGNTPSREFFPEEYDPGHFKPRTAVNALTMAQTSCGENPRTCTINVCCPGGDMAMLLLAQTALLGNGIRYLFTVAKLRYFIAFG
ncbi:hypothetical protein Bbelb_014960 [Branchiostoma belcheri]|nr:hypothetical protein Bbelb_014960 [Branchiostoma belcheri]